MTETQPSTQLPQSRYPHLPKDEIDIWERWLDKFGHLFYLIEYDVRVGTGVEPPPDIHVPYDKLCREMTKRRIDAVAHTADFLLIIEVTKSVGFRTIGQYFSYPVLYKLTYFPDKELRPTLVAENFITDVKPVADALHLSYDLV